MDYRIIQIDENTWQILDHDFVRAFLLTGSKEALLIDCCALIDCVKEIAAGITDLPVRLIVTHADLDHTACCGSFEPFYMHPAEASNYYNSAGKTGEFIPVEDGDVIDIGERPLRIISLPGHTPGSIALLDINKRVLFSGDSVQDGEIYMFGVQREIHAFMHSLKKLIKLKDEFDHIFPSHDSLPLPADHIDRLYEAALDMMAGKFEPEITERTETQVYYYDTGAAKFLTEIRY